MTVYFCDSSALVKCYVQEHGSAWMRTLVSADGELNMAARAKGLIVEDPNTR